MRNRGQRLVRTWVRTVRAPRSTGNVLSRLRRSDISTEPCPTQFVPQPSQPPGSPSTTPQVSNLRRYSTSPPPHRCLDLGPTLHPSSDPLFPIPARPPNALSGGQSASTPSTRRGRGVEARRLELTRFRGHLPIWDLWISEWRSSERVSAISCSRQTSRTERSPLSPASTISSFCCAKNLRYLRWVANSISFGSSGHPASRLGCLRRGYAPPRHPSDLGQVGVNAEVGSRPLGTPSRPLLSDAAGRERRSRSCPAACRHPEDSENRILLDLAYAPSEQSF